MGNLAYLIVYCGIGLIAMVIYPIVMDIRTNRYIKKLNKERTEREEIEAIRNKDPRLRRPWENQRLMEWDLDHRQ